MKRSAYQFSLARRLSSEHGVAQRSEGRSQGTSAVPTELQAGIPEPQVHLLALALGSRILLQGSSDSG